jgi:hypothetical protein
VTTSYEELNQELIEDMAKLHEDKNVFFLPLIGNVQTSSSQYFHHFFEENKV